MSKSLFGSVKSKLSRKSSEKTTTSSFERQPRSPARSPSSNMGRGLNPFTNQAGSTDEPPPAYSAAGSTSSLRPSASPAPSIASVTNDNDKYAFLSTFDTIFVIDDSGSMAGSNWREVSEALRAILPICTSHDKDGIDLYFLNHRSGSPAPQGKAANGYYNVTNPERVQDIFRRANPRSMTPTGTRLQSILKPYVASLERAADMAAVKPVNMIVITDGQPSDDPEAVIVQQARKLDRIDAPPYQVGIQFFQIGRDREAKEALTELDDGLAEQGVRDMVDTVTWDGTGGYRSLTADGILKVVLGAVVRRLDRKATSGDHRSRT